MAKDPIFPLYYNDILGATRTWTDEEFGAYLRLLIEEWDKGFIPSPCQIPANYAAKYLPNDLPTDFQRLARISTSVEKNWPLLSTKFIVGGGGLQNNVLQEIKANRLKFKDKQVENAKKRYQRTYQIAANIPAKQLPLENEYEIEKNKELNSIGDYVEEKRVYIPFSENFLIKWKGWLDYKKTEHKFSYKTRDTEQAAVDDLFFMSKANEDTAIKIIEKSIRSTWKGLFELKNNNNGQGNQINGRNYKNGLPEKLDSGF